MKIYQVISVVDGKLHSEGFFASYAEARKCCDTLDDRFHLCDCDYEVGIFPFICDFKSSLYV